LFFPVPLVDEILNVETPAKGSASFMEASRDYDEKIEFLQKVRARSGVDKSHRGKAAGHSRGRGLSLGEDDEQQNVNNLLRMSGSSFFRTSVHLDQDDSVDAEIQKVRICSSA
jgi:hypothetical protein